MVSSVWLLISQNGIWFTEIYWEYDLEIWWWLRSTTGSYGRLVLEATYGEIDILFHRGYLGDVSSGRVVGVSTWCITYGRHTRVNTSVDTVYVFSIFNTKSICIIFKKNLICIMKGYWWSLTLSWSDDDQRIFWPPMLFSLKKWENSQIYRIVSFKLELIRILVLHTICMTSYYYMLNLSFSSILDL